MLRPVRGFLLSVLSPQEILRQSVVHVTTATLLQGRSSSRPRHGHPDGLLSGRFGPQAGPFQVCADCVREGAEHRCSLSVCENEHCRQRYEERDGCPGHFGHITLAEEVYDIEFAPYLLKALRCLCWQCGGILSPRPFPQPVAHSVYSDYQRLAFYEKYGRTIAQCPHCATPITYDFATYKNMGELGYIGTLNAASDPVAGTEEELKLLRASEVAAFFRERVTDETCREMGFNVQYNRPDWMVIRYLPVPPLAVRMSSLSKSGGGDEDDRHHVYTRLLSTIVQVNNKLRLVLTSPQYNSVHKKQARVNLQYRVSMYKNHMKTEPYGMVKLSQTEMQKHKKKKLQLQQQSGGGGGGGAQEDDRTANETAKSLVTPFLKGKKGRVRGNLMGGRVDFSARSVITPDPNLAFDELGVPFSEAKILTTPERVTSWNIGALRALVQRGSEEYPGANKVEKRQGQVAVVNEASRRQLADGLKIGDTVHRHLQRGDLVMFNRQPSLHAPSMMGHRVRVMPYSTFRFNESVCTPYNADFDGDEMNLHVPQTIEARAEIEAIGSVRRQLINNRTGALTFALTQDSVSMVYRLTSKDTFFTRAEMSDLLMALAGNDVDAEVPQFPPPALMQPRALWTGKQLVSLAFQRAAITGFSYTAVDGDHPDPADANDRTVVMRSSELMCGQLRKRHVGTGTGSLFYALTTDTLHYGPEPSLEVMHALQRVAMQTGMLLGLSIGLSSVMIGDERGVRTYIERELREIDEYIVREGNGRPLKSYERDQVEREASRRLNSLRDGGLGRTTQAVAANEATNVAFLQRNGLRTTIDAGSKGSSLNIGQITSLLGQQYQSGQRMDPVFQSYADPTTSVPSYPETLQLVNTYRAIDAVLKKFTATTTTAASPHHSDILYQEWRSTRIVSRLNPLLEPMLRQYEYSLEFTRKEMTQQQRVADAPSSLYESQHRVLVSLLRRHPEHERAYRIVQDEMQRLRVQSVRDARESMRTLPHFTGTKRWGVLPAMEAGFVANSFLRGLHPTEFFFHAKGGREGLIDTAVKTAETGYLDRRLVKAEENLVTQYDLTVRFANTRRILQFAYGANNCNLKYQSHPVSLGTIARRDFVFERGDDPIDHAGRFAFCFRDWYGAINLPAIRAQLDTQCSKEYTQILYLLKANGYGNAGDVSIFIPFNTKVIIERTVLRRGEARDVGLPLSEFKLATEDVREALEHIRGVRRDLLAWLRDVMRRRQPTLVADRATAPVRLAVAFHLRTKAVLQWYRRAMLDEVVAEIRYRFEHALIEAGEAVGVIAAQSVGEPATQMTLTTFHTAGSATTTATGIPRLKSLWQTTNGRTRTSGAAGLEQRAIQVYLHPLYADDPDREYERLVHLAPQLVELRLRNILSEAQVLRTAAAAAEDTRDAEWLALERELMSDELLTQFTAAQESQRQWCVRLVVDAVRLESNWQLTLRQLADHLYSLLGDDCNDNDSVLVLVSPDNYTGAGVGAGVVRFYVSTGTPAQNERRATAILARLRNALIRGLCDVSVALVQREQSAEKRPYILLAGGHFKQVLGLRGVDVRRTRCNDTVEVLGTLGFCAAATTLMAESRAVYDMYGLYVYNAHMLLIVESMFVKGTIDPYSVHGMEKQGESSVFQMISYERALNMVVKGAVFSKQDRTDNVSTNVALGALIPSGTNTTFALTWKKDEKAVKRRTTPPPPPPPLPSHPSSALKLDALLNQRKPDFLQSMFNDFRDLATTTRTPPKSPEHVPDIVSHPSPEYVPSTVSATSALPNLHGILPRPNDPVDSVSSDASTSSSDEDDEGLYYKPAKVTTSRKRASTGTDSRAKRTKSTPQLSSFTTAVDGGGGGVDEMHTELRMLSSNLTFSFQ